MLGLVTPDGTPVFPFVPLPLFELPLLEFESPSSLFNCVPSTPPRTAPMMINSKIGRPIQSHLLRFFGLELYPRDEPPLAFGLLGDIGSERGICSSGELGRRRNRNMIQSRLV